MSLPAGKKFKVVTVGDITSGVNLNDPAMSIRDTEVAEIKNAIILKRGWKRWPGCVNLTAKDACSDYLRGLFHHSTIAGTQYLYVVFGQKLYSINKSTGALTELYTLTGDGEAYAASAHGTFFMANGTDVVKVEGTSATRVGIAAPAAPAAPTATPGTSGGSLADGTYNLYASYGRRVGGVDVLYSKGVSIGDVTVSGGSGSGKIAISSFANSADSQVGQKVIWMKRPADSTWYYYKSTGNNTTTAFDITSATPENSAITYSAYAAYNDLPGALDFIFHFDNRLWGVIDNILYYSQKGATVYNLEEWPANNSITYPYAITGLFSVGPHLCINTAENGVIVQPNADVSAKYEHYEQKTSFWRMQTVGDWNGNKIGLCDDRIGVFSKDTLTFEPWDYGYNIRPVLNRVWANSDSNHKPCGIVHRRDNRIEYLFSIQDTSVNDSNNNRTWVLNLSRTIFADVDNYRTPWEMVGRGFNFVAEDTGGTLYMGQSFLNSSTVFKELSTHSTEAGIYGDAGTYLDSATDMTIRVLSKSYIENMFTKSILENIRAMFKTNELSSVQFSIVDQTDQDVSQTTEQTALGQSLWDVMQWDDDNWSAEGFMQYEFKGEMGIFGYSWNFLFTQTDDDIDMQVIQFDVLITLETGRGI